VLVVDDRFPMFVCATWRNAVLESRRCESAPESLTFTIEPAQVLEHTGGFRIRLLDAVDHTPVWPLRVGLSLRGVHVGLGRSPGAEGVLECPQLPPGAISISLEFSDHERIAELLDVQSGVITDLGTRELSRANPCEIEVVDSSGGPLANVRFTLYDAAALAAQRPLEAGYQIASNSAGILPCQVGPSETWILPCDDHWTSEPARLPTGGRQRIIMQAGCELVTTIAATVRDDALLLVRGRDRRCVVIEQARPGFLVRSRLPPGHYEVELVTFDGTIASRSIELGDKPLVIDLAP